MLSRGCFLMQPFVGLKTRNMACALLTRQDQVLMIHRGTHKTIAPGMWACVGGHLEPEELNDPAAACLREVGEETGITPEQLSPLAMRYMIVRLAGEEVRITYLFIAQVLGEVILAQTAEGSLHWVPREQLPSLPMTYSAAQVMAHWLNAPDGQEVMLCAIEPGNDSVQWHRLG